MSDEIITLSKIHDIYFEEKENKELINLPKNIYEMFRNYLDLKEKQNKNSDNTYRKLELEQTKRVIENIYHIREKKIINMALYSYNSGEDVNYDVLSDLEKDFFDKQIRLLKKYKKVILENQKDSDNDVDLFKKPKSHKAIRVKFVRDVPAFKFESETFGPFVKGEAMEIPDKLAEKLNNMRMISYD
ncbi:MAG: DNA replication complex GINS family protein [Candidatus Nanoarchaeia archaeon]|nr:DNA replication complex GINS family protein [Candidatus Nanoarchaeia archaeon]